VPAKATAILLIHSSERFLFDRQTKKKEKRERERERERTSKEK